VAVAEQLLESFRARYTFPLDDFQVRAITAILDGKSVIVSAPTGSGKTLVAEFAIHAALHRGRRIAYTTPLKALSNQKYASGAPSRSASSPATSRSTPARRWWS
jgi:superfamily II RNA helicase